MVWTIREKESDAKRCGYELLALLRIDLLGSLTISQTSPFFTCLQCKSFENTTEKREIARTEQFLLFPSSDLEMSSATSFSMEESKIFRLGKG